MALSRLGDYLIEATRLAVNAACHIDLQVVVLRRKQARSSKRMWTGS